VQRVAESVERGDECRVACISAQSVMAYDFNKEPVEIYPVTCTRNFLDCEQIRSA
jgi:hypothetical protein